jgi:hypothetical protein
MNNVLLQTGLAIAYSSVRNDLAMLESASVAASSSSPGLMHQFNLPIDALTQEVRLISSPHFQRVT